jgi:hypothetical protein
MAFVWAPVPKRRRNRRNLRDRRPLPVLWASRAKPLLTRTTCLTSRGVVLVLIALHTREVAGSKPAAPIDRRYRPTSTRSRYQMRTG